ncbi:hypothetical protein ACFOHS_22545 [Jhaorihella thermophila]
MRLEFAYLSGCGRTLGRKPLGLGRGRRGDRVILDFGAGFVDHRGWFMDAGA